MVEHGSTFYLSRDAARKGRKFTSFALENKGREEMARRTGSSLLCPHGQTPAASIPPGQGTKPAVAHPWTRNSWGCFSAVVIFSSPLVGYQHVEPKSSLLKHSGEPFIFLFQFNWIVQTNKPNGPIPFPVTAVPSVRFTECFRNYS